MADGFALLGDDGVDEISDGDDADDCPVVHDGEMADAVVGDDAHAVSYGVVGGD